MSTLFNNLMGILYSKENVIYDDNQVIIRLRPKKLYSYQGGQNISKSGSRYFTKTYQDYRLQMIKELHRVEPLRPLELDECYKIGIVFLFKNKKSLKQMNGNSMILESCTKKRDVDNYAKGVADFLTDSGLIEDDRYDVHREQMKYIKHEVAPLHDDIIITIQIIKKNIVEI